jgi:hypothetical protein
VGATSQPATSASIKKTTGQLQKLLGQFTVLISDLMKKAIGIDFFVSFPVQFCSFSDQIG